MRDIVVEKLEAARVRNGELGSDASYGLAGAFELIGPKGTRLLIFSGGKDGSGWEHVSVSTEHRTPNWAEMCFVKDLFFEDNECVVQYHPPAAKHINHHPYVLHMWRPTDVELPMPPMIMV